MNSVRRLQNSVIYIYGVRSYKNLASEWDWGVWHVSINLDWHLEWNTPGSLRRYAGIFGGLLSKHPRYQAFTFFEAESGIRSKVESKAGREPNRPIRKSNRLKKKKIPHTLCQVEFLLGLIYVVQSCVSNESPYKNNVAVEIPFAVRYPDQARLLYANFVPTSISPTLYGMLNSVVRFLHQRTNDTGTNNLTDQGVHMYRPWWCCCCCLCCCWWCSKDEGPAGQLNLELLNINNCLN